MASRADWERKGRKDVTAEPAPARRPLHAPILWLREPEPLSPHSTVRVVGVSSDAPREVRDLYLLAEPVEGSQ